MTHRRCQNQVRRLRCFGVNCSAIKDNEYATITSNCPCRSQCQEHPSCSFFISFIFSCPSLCVVSGYDFIPSISLSPSLITFDNDYNATTSCLLQGHTGKWISNFYHKRASSPFIFHTVICTENPCDELVRYGSARSDGRKVRLLRLNSRSQRTKKPSSINVRSILSVHSVLAGSTKDGVLPYQLQGLCYMTVNRTSTTTVVLLLECYAFVHASITRSVLTDG